MWARVRQSRRSNYRPITCIACKVYAFTSMGVVVLSTVVFILSTMPELTDTRDMVVDNTTNINNETADEHERWEKVRKHQTAIWYEQLTLASGFRAFLL